MRGPTAAFAAALAFALCACSPTLKGVDEAALQDAVSRAIGDPGTCVLLVNESGGTLWRYGSHMTCARTLPSCEKPGETTSVDDLAHRAVKGETVAVSCPSTADGLRSVGWASGKVRSSPKATHPPLFFAAVMEGERTLPGREITARLAEAFADVGL